MARVGRGASVLPDAGPPETSREPAGTDIDGFEVLVAGTGGGPIDVLFPAPIFGLGFIPAAGLEPTDGVVVRGVEVPEVAAELNCFVGDFVGDYDVILA